MFGVNSMFARMVDLVSNKTKSAQALIRQGEWRFIQLGNYTLASPLLVNNNNKVNITYQLSDVSYTEGNGLDVSYDYVNQKWTPNTQGDVFLVDVRMKVKSSAQNSHLDFIVESPTFAFNPVNASTQSFVHSANDEQFISNTFVLFIGVDVLANGLKFYLEAHDGNFQVYDVSYTVVRVASGV